MQRALETRVGIKLTRTSILSHSCHRTHLRPIRSVSPCPQCPSFPYIRPLLESSPITEATVYNLPNSGGPVNVTVKRVTTDASLHANTVARDKAREAMLKEARALQCVASTFAVGLVGIGVSANNHVECLLLKRYDFGDLQTYLRSRAGDPTTGQKRTVSIPRRVSRLTHLLSSTASSVSKVSTNFLRLHFVHGTSLVDTHMSCR